MNKNLLTLLVSGYPWYDSIYISHTNSSGLLFEMKALDVTKCHEESPDFRENLLHMEVCNQKRHTSTNVVGVSLAQDALEYLDKKLKKICAICLEREKLAVKDRELMRGIPCQLMQLPLR